MTQEPHDAVEVIRKFWGAALMAVGGLIAGRCGSCTLLIVGMAFSDFAAQMMRGDLSWLGTLPILLIGIVPTFVGVLLFRAGLRRFRPPRPKVAPGTFE